MLVRFWMTRDPITIDPRISVSQAAALMAEHRIRRLPIVTSRRGAAARLVGIVTLTDVARAFPPDCNPLSPAARTNLVPTPVSAIMTARPLTIAGDAPLEDAARLMAERKIGALPVVVATQIVGIITESDVFRALVGALGTGPNLVRITFDTSHDDQPFGTVVALAARHGMRVAGFLTVREQGRSVCVLRAEGSGAAGFVDDLRATGHQVLRILGPAATRRST